MGIEKMNTFHQELRIAIAVSFQKRVMAVPPSLIILIEKKLPNTR